MKRKIYLETVPTAEALNRLLRVLQAHGWGPREEMVSVDAALGRLTARPVAAQISAPHYHGSAMDGVAVKAQDTFLANETNPLTLIFGEQAFWVDTGDPIPAGCDAVIMVEHVNLLSEAHQNGAKVEILAPASPWQHIRTIGEDIVATEILLSEGQLLRPQDVGALLAAGILEVPVVRRPVVTFIPTGNELVQPKVSPESGEIIEFNSRMVLGQVMEWGGMPVRHEIVRDHQTCIKESILAAVQSSDIVIINAGSSAGSEDYSVHVLTEIGEVLVHGVAVRPAKPVILAVVQGKPVIGLPGYPVSSWLAADLFVKPLVFRAFGLPAPQRPVVKARLARRAASVMGVDDYIRVKLGKVGERLIATPIGKGAGVISSLVRADGLTIISAGREGAAEGEEVEVELLRPVQEIDKTLVATGSHDTALDLLAGFLRRFTPDYHLSSAHVGSLAGLVALKRGEAHMAGIHLLDEETGEYNVTYVKRYVGRSVILLLLAKREQGFLVAKGNPKGVRSFRDLTRSDITYVNRQRGAGTRLLLDYHLKRNAIDAQQIRGYAREEYTHLNVAAAIWGGAADTGLGIRAVATALGLDFVPVGQEEYEICIPAEIEEHPGIQATIKTIGDPAFRLAVEALDGYDATATGRIRRIE